jgi:hypothetical protein
VYRRQFLQPTRDGCVDPRALEARRQHTDYFLDVFLAGLALRLQALFEFGYDIGL